MSERKKYDVEKLRDLLAQCEGAFGANRRLDIALHDFFGFTREDHCRDWCRENGRTDLTREQYLTAWARYFTASLDAGLDLLDRVLPGRGYVTAKGRLRPDEPLFGAIVYADLTNAVELGAAEGAAPALVLCLAILRALIAIEEARA